jgi:hypothetical protein
MVDKTPTPGGSLTQEESDTYVGGRLMASTLIATTTDDSSPDVAVDTVHYTWMYDHCL